MGRCPILLAAILALALGAPDRSDAHPHVFIDGGADVVFDTEGRLAALDITWIYDPLTSLFMMEELGLSDTGPLTAEARVALAAYQTEWIPEFQGDSYLLDGERPVPLSGPREPDAEIREGRVVITFRRDLATPFRPAPDAVVEIYDPTYFTAYAITETPEIIGPHGGCTAEVDPFEPTEDLATLQMSLFDIPADEDPEENLGRLFADRIRIACD